MKTNLLAETLEALKERNKSPSDVLWVGTNAARGSWDDFAALADIEYDAGYGGNEINENLVIVGDNWWLERGEYDGSEWWDFKTIPNPPDDARSLGGSDLPSEWMR